MSKKMLINATHPEENRVAIVADGRLTELDIEVAGREQTKGNIYKATVVRVEPGLQAAFVDYGAERFGFLQLGEVRPDLYPSRLEGKGRPRMQEVLHRGQELLVQIVKEERGTKGAALTTYLSFPGRYMVLMPGTDLRTLSRKIGGGDERRLLKEAMAGIEVPDDIGYIVRTASLGQSPEELHRDFSYLLRLYQIILDAARKAKAPALVYRESNLVIRSIRDYFTTDIDEVLVDDPEVAEEAKAFFQQVMPDYVKLVKLHQERRPIFSRYQIEEQIETITQKKVPLPSGGSIVIDTTEALVAIDVNSGKSTGEQGVEATATRTNLEAAEEVARQLRLRDLGGLIVIDFIDMQNHGHIRDVEKRLKESLKGDKAQIDVGRISRFGLLEMSRQRIKAALAEGSYSVCPACEGSGRVKSPEAQAVAALRKIQTAIAKSHVGRVAVTVPAAVADYLLNDKREELVEMERRSRVDIVILGSGQLPAGHLEIESSKRDKDERDSHEPLATLKRLAPHEEDALLAAQRAESENAAETAADKGDAAGKKKRKRRKRKKTDEEGTPAGAGAASAAEAGEEPGAADEAEAADGEPGEPGAPAEGAAPEGAKKKRRRRRRKKPEAGVETPEAAATAQDEVPAPSPDAPQPAPTPAAVTAEENAAAPPAPAQKTPRRRTPRKKVEAAPESAPEPGAETAAAAETQDAPPAKKPARRRSTKKPAGEPETVAAPEEAAAPKTTRRRTAKPKAGDAAPAEPATATAEAAPDKPAKKPVRRRKKVEPTDAPATPDAPEPVDA